MMTELPLVIIDVQRGGPSTGLPTKTEQADLLQAMFGRNGESPLAVIAPRTPSDCFEMRSRGVPRSPCSYMTPVIFLSDGYIANGSEPWQIPEHQRARGDQLRPRRTNNERVPALQARPGTRPPVGEARHAGPGAPHRRPGEEDNTGNISYEPKNHEQMVRPRRAKIDGIAVPDLEVDDPTGEAELLMVGWGSSYGRSGGVRRARRKGIKVAHAHLRNLNPFPANLGEVLRRYPNVVLPEMNLGQLAMLLRGRFLVDVQSVTKVEGMAFLADRGGGHHRCRIWTER